MAGGYTLHSCAPHKLVSFVGGLVVLMEVPRRPHVPSSEKSSQESCGFPILSLTFQRCHAKTTLEMPSRKRRKWVEGAGEQPRLSSWIGGVSTDDGPLSIPTGVSTHHKSSTTLMGPPPSFQLTPWWDCIDMEIPPTIPSPELVICSPSN